MVNNYINVNKTKDYIWHQITEHKKQRHMPKHIQILIWDKQTHMMGLTRLIEPLSLWLDLQQQHSDE